MVATIIISISIGLYLFGFAFVEIRRRAKGKKSLFLEDDCNCRSLNSRRLVAYYRKQKKLAMKKEGK